MTIIVNGSNTPTAGAVGYGDGTNLAFTSAGTAGQFLSSNGSSAPSWVGAPASAMTLISTQTASLSSSLSWTGLSGYGSYLLVFNNLVPNTNGGGIRVQVGTGSTTYITSGYSNNTNLVNVGSSSIYYDTGATYIGIGTSNGMTNSGVGASGFLYFESLSGTNSMLSVNGIVTAQYSTGSASSEIINGSLPSNTTTKTAIQINSNSTIKSGTASLYGISS